MMKKVRLKPMKISQKAGIAEPLVRSLARSQCGSQ